MPLRLRFIDLFAGLGGFHLALKNLGHVCVFASEIDPKLRELYRINFGIDVHGDIKDIDEATVPVHDVLCAGFPCQPFSKAGEQAGLEDPRWGGLFLQILRIVRHHRPRFLMLENVPNIMRHDNGKTWAKMIGSLEIEGYNIRFKILSPHHYGIPQIRERTFVVGSLGEMDLFKWPEQNDHQTSISTILDKNPEGARSLSPQAMACIDTWQDFIAGFPNNEELPSFPIWAMEFGASYPYENMTPYWMESAGLREYLGAYGQSLSELHDESIFAALPSYARERKSTFPHWKVNFIRQNRMLYERNRSWIDQWRPKIRQFPPSFQKLEWNVKGGTRDLSKYVLQFRASGVRVKRPTTAPSLVAMTATQVPVITWEKRYMTPLECARLQNMESLALPKAPTRAYAALGNAVNARLVEFVALSLFAKSVGQFDYHLSRSALE